MTKLAFDAAHKADRLSGIWTRRMAATLKSTAATIAMFEGAEGGA